jgi:hypothetical protein
MRASSPPSPSIAQKPVKPRKSKPRPSATGSPSLDTAAAPRERTKAPKTQPHSSPNTQPTNGVGGANGSNGSVGAEPPPFQLPESPANSNGAAVAPGKVPVPTPVPEAPPVFQKTSLIGDKSGIGVDEAYSNDEQALNNFLKLHPMLSLGTPPRCTTTLLDSHPFPRRVRRGHVAPHTAVAQRHV